MTKVYLIPNAVSEVPDSNPFAKDVTTRVFPVFSMFFREQTFCVVTLGDFLYQSGYEKVSSISSVEIGAA